MAIFEIQLQPNPQAFYCPIGERVYRVETYFVTVDNGGWAMDISDDDLTPIVCGIPLVTGANLIEMFPELGIKGIFYIVTDGNAVQVPNYSDLGTRTRLYYEVEGDVA